MNMVATAKRPPIPHKVLTLVDLDGRLALFMAARLLSDEPIREIAYRVSGLRLGGDIGSQWQPFVGLTVDRGGYAYLNGRYTQLDTDAWEWRQVREAVPKPRDGKDHTWTWVGQTFGYRVDERNGWRKAPFPRCAECYESFNVRNGRTVTNNTHHDPTWTPAECGQCHPNGQCDERGFCKPIESE